MGRFLFRNLRVSHPSFLYTIIDRTDDFVKRNLIFKNNIEGNEEKWLGIKDSGNKITEFEILEEAKDHYRYSL